MLMKLIKRNRESGVKKKKKVGYTNASSNGHQIPNLKKNVPVQPFSIQKQPGFHVAHEPSTAWYQGLHLTLAY